MKIFEKRRVRKDLKHTVHSGMVLLASRGDLLSEDDLALLNENIGKAKEALKSGCADYMESSGDNLEKVINQLNPQRPMEWLHENFDVLVVAISVAMAFRAYFYQPFKIPTGSMQPTLYGIHSIACDPAEVGFLDKKPICFAKWIFTGSIKKVIRAKVSGTVNFMSGSGSKKPGYTPVVVAGYPHYVPNDSLERNTLPLRLKGGVANGASVHKGAVLWSGTVTTGDFVFVNRWKWNFMHPQRGEVMVFSTKGIVDLQQGTHYIKRMTGLPNETLQIKAPNLFVDGEMVTGPGRLGLIAKMEKIGDWAPPYAGFNPGTPQKRRHQQLNSEEATVTLTDSQYYAMGDNSKNSFDSRYWGSVPEKNLLGPATLVYWPFTSHRLGWIK